MGNKCPALLSIIMQIILIIDAKKAIMWLSSKFIISVALSAIIRLHSSWDPKTPKVNSSFDGYFKTDAEGILSILYNFW